MEADRGESVLSSHPPDSIRAGEPTPAWPPGLFGPGRAVGGALVWAAASGTSLLASVGGSAHRLVFRVWGCAVCGQLPKPRVSGKPPDFRRTVAVYLKPYKQFTANGAQFTGRDLSAEQPGEGAERAGSPSLLTCWELLGDVLAKGPTSLGGTGGGCWLLPRSTYALSVSPMGARPLEDMLKS